MGWLDCDDDAGGLLVLGRVRNVVEFDATTEDATGGLSELLADAPGALGCTLG